MSQYAIEFKLLDAEMALVDHFRDQHAKIFIGDTDHERRKERFRRACRRVKDGEIEIYSRAFERLYGEPLQVKPLKGKRA